MRVGIAYPAFYGAFKKFFPDLVVLTPETTKKMDLVIFSGGEDIHPRLYRQPVTHAGGISVERDDTEREIYTMARAYGCKILGVCRGLQLIVALNGGSLYQDIYFETHKTHAGTHKIDHMAVNTITLAAGDYVNSMHHQGASSVPSNFMTLSEYAGIPEIIMAENNREVLVQFHPEFSDNVGFFKAITEWVTDKSPRLTLRANPRYRAEIPAPDESFVSTRKKLKNPGISFTMINRNPSNLFDINEPFEPDAQDSEEDENEPEYNDDEDPT